MENKQIYSGEDYTFTNDLVNAYKRQLGAELSQEAVQARANGRLVTLEELFEFLLESARQAEQRFPILDLEAKQRLRASIVRSVIEAVIEP